MTYIPPEQIAKQGRFIETVQQWGETFHIYQMGGDFFGITPGQTWVAKFEYEEDGTQ